MVLFYYSNDHCTSASIIAVNMVTTDHYRVDIQQDDQKGGITTTTIITIINLSSTLRYFQLNHSTKRIDLFHC